MEHLVWRQVTIPKGLPALLELIARETLRHNPESMYDFIADLLEKEERKEAGEVEEEEERIAESQQNQPRKAGESEDTHLLVKNESLADVVSSPSPVVSPSPPPKSQDEVINLIQAIRADSSLSKASSDKPDDTDFEIIDKSPEPKAEVVAAPVEEPTIIEKISASVTTSPAKSISDGESQSDIERREQRELEQLLEASLDTKEIQDLRASGDFANVSVAEDDDEEEEEEEEELEDDDEEEPVKVEPVKATKVQVVSQQLKPKPAEVKVESSEEEEEEEEEEDEEEEEEEEEDEEEIDPKKLDAKVADEISKSDDELLEAAAATKIQAGFRGYKARQNLKHPAAKEDSVVAEPAETQSQSLPASPVRSVDDDKEAEDADDIPAPIPAVVRRAGSIKIRSAEGRMEATKHERSNRKSAATKIQATVRGFLTRRRLAKSKVANRRRSSLGSSEINKRRRSSLKIDAAAVRIQAAFRGYNVRKGKGSNKNKNKPNTSHSPSSKTVCPPQLPPSSPSVNSSSSLTAATPPPPSPPPSPPATVMSPDVSQTPPKTSPPPTPTPTATTPPPDTEAEAETETKTQLPEPEPEPEPAREVGVGHDHEQEQKNE